MGDWSTSDRRQRLPGNWPQLRAQTLARDGGRCVKCGRTATDVDHVRRGDDHRLVNLQSLCAEHHKQKTAAEAVAARAQMRAKAKRPREQHPGALGSSSHPRRTVPGEPQ